MPSLTFLHHCQTEGLLHSETLLSAISISHESSFVSQGNKDCLDWQFFDKKSPAHDRVEIDLMCTGTGFNA